MKQIFYLSLLTLLVLACGKKEAPRQDTIPYVKQLASDTTGVLNLLSSYRADGTAGSIALIGEPSAVLPLSERFLSVDAVDNIDGKAGEDRLPDFAGETFDVCIDLYNEPYDRFLAAHSDSLREIAVRNAVFAADSICLSGAMQPDSHVPKNRAKVYVLASSLLSAYGQFDIDTLFKMAGKTPVIISPVHALMVDALSDGPAKIGVWAPRGVESLYRQEFDALEHEGSSLMVLDTEPGMDPRRMLRDFLRRYRDSGARELSCLLLDAFDHDLFQLKAEIDHIRLCVTEEDRDFDRLISPGFRIIDPKQALTDECYRVLRRENLFTHNIAYPTASYYQTEESPDGTFTLVPVSRRFLSENWTRYVDAGSSALPYVSEDD